MNREEQWLAELASNAALLPQDDRPRPYWSQRRSTALRVPASTSPQATMRRTRRIIAELFDEHFFADRLGFDCVDGDGDSAHSAESELEARVGKPGLWKADVETWHEDDFCDFVEVFHDLAARPLRTWHHNHSGCGWHPLGFSRRSGQALYRWRVNQVLDGPSIGLRLAEAGEDVGRMVRAVPGEPDELIEEVLTTPSTEHDELAHAIALFRSRGGTRQERRSAVAVLARILEARRSFLKDKLLSRDEGALFQIANEFDIRHNNADQRADYRMEFLDWIFYWYLATIQLTDRLAAADDQRRR